MKDLYEIRNIQCAYGLNVVLNIEELNIKQGHLTFVVGSSGTGKSTFIETLGLMRNTLQFQDNSILNFFVNDEKVNLKNSWDQRLLSELDRYRKKHLSFVFQNSLLFENFTVYENIIMPSLIKGSEHDLSFNKIKENWLDKFGLNEIGENHVISALSAGQKQRVAFIRGLLPKFQVLFGDEPTGNLDTKNAVYLIERLRHEIRATGQSAIIVTHDLSNAVDFGDRIILLTKEKDDIVSHIRPENQFHKKNNKWYNNLNEVSFTDHELHMNIYDRI